MLENLPDFENMTQKDAKKRLKVLNREIKKHELAFLLFVGIGIITIMLIIFKSIPFDTLSIATLAICIGCCYGIFKYSEPYELEKYFIELIFGKEKKKNKKND